MSAPFRLKPFDATHDRSAFRCGTEQLDSYLREQVSQDIRRRVAACFVALADSQRIAGYYTVASASLLLADIPAAMAKNSRVIRQFRQCVLAAWPWIWNSRDRVWEVRFLPTPWIAPPARDRGPRFDGRRNERNGGGLLSASRLHRLARFLARPFLPLATWVKNSK